MKFCWLFGCFLALASQTRGQFQAANNSTLHVRYANSASAYMNGTQRTPIPGLRGDRSVNYRYTSPWLTQWPGTSVGQGYWLGSTTTQSFNHGKWGTIYYYDMLGDLRYARTFIDIAGKNKRGLKLLLPTFNQRWLMQR